MSSITRTLTNLRKIGFKVVMRCCCDEECWLTCGCTGDTKYGQLIGTDKFGNKFFENNDELPLRTRWVEYKKHDYDAAHIEPGWHAWISYSVDTPPTLDPVLETKVRKWETPDVRVNPTGTPGAYRPYNTTVPKISSWEPQAVARQ
ncbi:hypothetical protein TD95_004984 [Thielaviopsis punctulata]|uniref:NADH dehydrogenase [ubiquinone] 1 alpha subcomplex subunit n=1 Tax=Thielaviopsis punctulata TaxID=72032 RepID=A0A0F4ZDF9_9PEZI|nr:hypothetical protein TD95_004984 [Thielaviopsis punctulata]